MKRCILCLAALLLTACGASGALYLPDHPKSKPGLLNKQRKADGAQQPAAPAPTNPPAAADSPSNPQAASQSSPQANPDSGTTPAPQP